MLHRRPSRARQLGLLLATGAIALLVSSIQIGAVESECR